MTELGKVDGGDLVKCSFCGKSQKAVKKLIAGPGVYICEECIALCNDILVDEGHVGGLPSSANAVTVPRAELTAVVRTLDQAVGAVGSGNVRIADEAARLAARLHQRLQAPSDDGGAHGGEGAEGASEPDAT